MNELEEIKEIIKTNWHLIEDKKFNELYDVAERSIYCSSPAITRLLYDADIDPLVYFKDSIPQRAFAYIKMPDADLVIPEGITMIEREAFDRSQFNSIKLPNTIKYIEFEAFGNISLKVPLNLPDSIEKIGNGAFQYSNVLDNLVIPSSCTFIDYYAFLSDFNVSSVEVKNPNCALLDGCFSFDDGLFKLQKVTLPNKYKKATDIRRIFGYKNTLELRKRVKFTWI